MIHNINIAQNITTQALYKQNKMAVQNKTRNFVENDFEALVGVCFSRVNALIFKYVDYILK